MDSLGWIVAAAIVVAIIAIGIWAITHSRTQRALAAEWAEQHGWTYTPGTVELPGNWNGFPFVYAAAPRPGEASNALEGTVDGARAVFLRYAPTSTSDQNSMRWHTLSLELNRAVPTIACVPAELSTTLGKLLPTHRKIETGNQDFDRAWAVFALESADDEPDPDNSAAQDLLHHRFTNRLIEPDAERARGTIITLDDHHVIAAWPGDVKLERIDQTLPILRDLARLINDPS